jgi:hypothetical protein
VTIVDDIMVRRNVATQKLDGLTVERAQPNEVPETVFARASIPMAASTARSTGRRSLTPICCS